MADGVISTQGYAQEAEELLVRYEAIPFEQSHAEVLHLIPEPPARALDIGSGTGRDAAYLDAAGHRVVAVEPTDALRIPASQLHPSPTIEWIDDYLPDLKTVVARGDQYDLVMMTAVWMHLEEEDRRQAMPVIASLMKPGGVLIMTLRHGTVPAGRRMFDVSAEETIALAQAENLMTLMTLHRESKGEQNRKAGITWTRLAFRTER